MDIVVLQSGTRYCDILLNLTLLRARLALKAYNIHQCDEWIEIEQAIGNRDQRRICESFKSIPLAGRTRVHSAAFTLEIVSQLVLKVVQNDGRQRVS